MTPERISRIVERLLTEAETATLQEDWAAVEALTREALELDSDSDDALILQDFVVTRVPRVPRVRSWKTPQDDSDQLRSEAVSRFLSGSKATVQADEQKSPSDAGRVQLSGRIQRVVEAFLDQAEESVAARDWERVTTLTEYARGLDTDNVDAAALQTLARSQRGLSAPTPVPTRRKGARPRSHDSSIGSTVEPSAPYRAPSPESHRSTTSSEKTTDGRRSGATSPSPLPVDAVRAQSPWWHAGWVGFAFGFVGAVVFVILTAAMFPDPDAAGPRLVGRFIGFPIGLGLWGLLKS